MVFYRNCEESNVLSDIVVAHSTSVAMIRTWSYVLIMDTTYETNKLRNTDKLFNKSTTYMLHLLCQMATVQFSMKVQWQYHRDVRVSGWADPYHNRIVDWVTRYHEMYPLQSHWHVVIN
ncbi:hypothetical protein M9H77_16497 [Catharanthus roseus]|uniref:Uncharacterized protein n=1 Tax=Catharanthus roseus TaxID=4058 RepID=A0ACC0B1Y5_CATRO|nr:hypothetical protein M9H77_16497 [Catharanthus roseus]